MRVYAKPHVNKRSIIIQTVNTATSVCVSNDCAGVTSRRRQYIYRSGPTAKWRDRICESTLQSVFLSTRRHASSGASNDRLKSFIKRTGVERRWRPTRLEHHLATSSVLAFPKHRICVRYMQRNNDLLINAVVAHADTRWRYVYGAFNQVKRSDLDYTVPLWRLFSLYSLLLHTYRPEGRGLPFADRIQSS